MDKTILRQWVEIAVQVCGLDSAKDTATKHKGLCNLQAIIYKELGSILDDCLDDVTGNYKGTRFTQYYNEIDACLWQNKTYNNSKNLLTNHLPEIEEWEKDDDEMEGNRCVKLSQYKYTYVDTLEVKGYHTQINYDGSGGSRMVEDRVPHPDSIYCKDGLYRKFWEYRCTGEYRLLRALQAHTDSDDELETLYKSVMLYVSLSNEQAEVEALAATLGVQLTENASELPQNERMPQNKATIHWQAENAPEMKLKRFLSVVPSKNHKKAKSLLQRVIKEGYCNEYYYWNASKWDNEKSRLALACFCFLASERLQLKPYEYTHNKNKFESESRNATNWQAFEMLFEYDGKKADKYGKYHQLADKKKQQCKYDEQERFYKSPEMIEIKKLFRA